MLRALFFFVVLVVVFSLIFIYAPAVPKELKARWAATAMTVCIASVGALVVAAIATILF